MRLPITLPLRRSGTLTVALVVAHLCAAAGLVVAGLFPMLLVPALVALAWSLAASLRRPASGALVLGRDARLTLVRGDGSSIECEIAPSTTVLPWLVVMRLKMSDHVESLVLPVDAIGADGHRQLRVWLKWLATSSAA